MQNDWHNRLAQSDRHRDSMSSVLTQGRHALAGKSVAEPSPSTALVPVGLDVGGRSRNRLSLTVPDRARAAPEPVGAKHSRAGRRADRPLGEAVVGRGYGSCFWHLMPRA
jgi:hypothetical protein